MNSNNTILELRQKDAINVYNNGSWSSSLSQTQTINAGDSVIINKCFIDTQAQTDQKIIIEKEVGEITLNLQNYIYHTNSYFEGITQENTAQKNDGDDYIWCSSKKIDHTFPADIHLVQTIRVKRQNQGAVDEDGWGDKSNGSNPLTLQYIDLNDNPQTFYIDIPYVSARKKTIRHRDIKVNIIAKDGSIKRDYNDRNWIFQNATLEGVSDLSVPAHEILTPRYGEMNIVIKSGAYEPQDICDIINNELTDNKSAGTEFGIDGICLNNFLHSSVNVNAVDGTPIGRDYLVKNDGTQALYYTNTADAHGNIQRFWLGASQLELDWDSDSNYFFWKFLHSPVYLGGNIISNFVKNERTNQFFHNGKNGGIAWSSLSATCSDNTSKHFGDNYDFWNKKLGFNVSAMCVHYNSIETALDSGTKLLPSFKSWKEGLNITTSRPNLSALIEKSGATGYRLCPSTEAEVLALNSQNDLTTIIQADKPVLNGLVLDYGYFYIEIGCGIYNEIVGGVDDEGNTQHTTNIQGIVNRYYSLGAYTSGSTDSSLIYRHTGDPLYINQIKCRILDSDKNLATSIGDDNTIFLEIVRGQGEKA